MSQVLVSKVKAALYQDIEFPVQKPSLRSSATAPSCHVCQQGLENKITITAKRIDSKILFFCNLHYPKSRNLIPKFGH